MKFDCGVQWDIIESFLPAVAINNRHQSLREKECPNSSRVLIVIKYSRIVLCSVSDKR